MEGAIGVVHLKMGPLGAISLHVHGIEGHRVRINVEDGGLVHVVPEAVHVVAALEDVIGEEVAPELLSVLVEEVDPG